MKKKAIVIPSLLVLTVFCMIYTIDIWIPFIQRQMPKPEIVIDKPTRKEAIDTLIAKLNENYVFPEKAKQVETLLRQHMKEGRYDRITDGEQFANQLTIDLHGVTRDLHMGVRASAKPVPYDRESRLHRRRGRIGNSALLSPDACFWSSASCWGKSVRRRSITSITISGI